MRYFWESNSVWIWSSGRTPLSFAGGSPRWIRNSVRQRFADAVRRVCLSAQSAAAGSRHGAGEKSLFLPISPLLQSDILSQGGKKSQSSVILTCFSILFILKCPRCQQMEKTLAKALTKTLKNSTNDRTGCFIATTNMSASLSTVGSDRVSC